MIAESTPSPPKGEAWVIILGVCVLAALASAFKCSAVYRSLETLPFRTGCITVSSHALVERADVMPGYCTVLYCTVQSYHNALLSGVIQDTAAQRSLPNPPSVGQRNI